MLAVWSDFVLGSAEVPMRLNSHIATFFLHPPFNENGIHLNA